MTDYRKIPTKISGFIELKQEITPRRFHNKYREYEIARNLMSQLKPAIPTKRYEISTELIFDMDEKFYDAVAADVDHGEFILQDYDSDELSKIIFENDTWKPVRGRIFFYESPHDLAKQLPPDTLHAAYRIQEKIYDRNDLDELINGDTLPCSAKLLTDEDKDNIISEFRDSLDWDDSPLSRLIGTAEGYLNEPNLDKSKIYSVWYRKTDGSTDKFDVSGVSSYNELGTLWENYASAGNIDAESLVAYEMWKPGAKDVHDIKSFASFVASNIVDYVPDDYKDSVFSIEEIVKINSTANYTALLAKKDPSSLGALVNLDLRYADFENLDGDLDEAVKTVLQRIADEIVNKTQHAYSDEVCDAIRYFGAVQQNAFLRVVNKKSLPPYTPFFPVSSDLCAVVSIPVKKKDGSTEFVTVTDALMAYYKITEAHLHRSILANLGGNRYCKQDFRPLGQFIGKTAPVVSNNTCVLTTEAGEYGAGIIAYPEVLANVHATIGENYYVLPSSVHEVLVIRESDVNTVLGLVNLVKKVNMTEVADKDVLADNVYYYDGATETLESIL